MVNPAPGATLKTPIPTFSFMNWPNNRVRRGTLVTGQLVLSGGGRTIKSAVTAFRTP